jgi:hypothetical protein
MRLAMMIVVSIAVAVPVGVPAVIATPVAAAILVVLFGACGVDQAESDKQRHPGRAQ